MKRKKGEEVYRLRKGNANNPHAMVDLFNYCLGNETTNLTEQECVDSLPFLFEVALFTEMDKRVFELAESGLYAQQDIANMLSVDINEVKVVAFRYMEKLKQHGRRGNADRIRSVLRDGAEATLKAEKAEADAAIAAFNATWGQRARHDLLKFGMDESLIPTVTDSDAERFVLETLNQLKAREKEIVLWLYQAAGNRAAIAAALNIKRSDISTRFKLAKQAIWADLSLLTTLTGSINMDVVDAYTARKANMKK